MGRAKGVYLNSKGIEILKQAIDNLESKNKGGKALADILGNISGASIDRLKAGKQAVETRTIKLICEGVGFKDWRNYVIESEEELEFNPVLLYPCTERFSYLIEDKTKRFVGREYVLDSFDRFTQKNDRGYFLLQGEPGEGKSAIAAWYAKTNDCLYYFNIRGEGQNTTELFLENICLQLIQRYDLKNLLQSNKQPKSLPVDATKNSSFLLKLLSEASKKKENDSKIVIVVDALDEVDFSSQDINTNVLYLPKHLPEGVYFFLTSRRDVAELQGRLGFETSQAKINLADFPKSYDDIEDYIRDFLRDEEYEDSINAWLLKQGKDQKELIVELKEKSLRNFLYISLILPELANPEGIYKDALIKELPEGLNRYYDKHWALMDVSADRLRIVCVISRANTLYTCEQIAYLSGEYDYLKVQLVLNSWMQFLDKRRDKEGSMLYKFYHESYKDYVFMKEEVKLACGDPEETDNRIFNNIFPSDVFI
ncbi:MAG: ATP-binding protein [Brasilonema octagenarum HA4186-MV1]|jgi:hypothetical protein|nr:ATP-binding protein [Brasilonema octagenarum HA4186-MV1]